MGVHDTKTCGFCGEEIKSVALKCRYCGETIDHALRAANEAKQMVRDQARIGRESPIIVSNNNNAASSAAAVAVVPMVPVYRRRGGLGIMALGFSMFVAGMVMTVANPGEPGIWAVIGGVGMLLIPVGAVVAVVQWLAGLFS